MKWARLLLALSSFLAPCHVAAWSGAAHQAIAEAAQGQLTPAAQTALARILQNTDTLSPGVLARGAMWPDELRARLRHRTIPDHWSPANVEEADQFSAAHPSHPQWHYVNLPLGAGAYATSEPSPTDPLRQFVSVADIVHAIARCIAILEAPTTEPKFSKPQAVRWLVHLVGDLHQPLHVTSGYYNTTVASFANTPTRITDPVKAAGSGVLGDRGGNGLLFSANESNNLHSLWDRCLPGVVSGASCTNGPTGFTPLAVHLTALMTPSAVAAASTPGSHRSWPAAWATDALERAVASHVYPPSLSNGRVKLDTHGEEESVLARITAPTKNAYVANHVAEARAQLLKAAVRLAALLNAIVWP